MKKEIAVLIMLMAFCFLTISQEKMVSSPDGRLVFELNDEDGLHYSVKSGNFVIIENGHLGLSIKRAQVLGKFCKLSSVDMSEVDNTWSPVLKQHKAIRDHYNQAVFTFKEFTFPGRTFNVVVRAFNDGIAFRYDFPKGSLINPTMILEKELTTFPVNAKAICWAADYGSFTTHQEKPFVKQQLKDISSDAVIGLPLTICNRVYLSITEAHLENWAGMYLGSEGEDENGLVNLRVMNPTLPSDPQKRMIVNTKLPAQSPWRVILVGDEPGDLIESEIVLNLNPPCEIDDSSWIKPGLCAWDNWWSGDVKMNTTTIKEYIDLASENGWPYMLIDWQWYGQYNMPTADVTTVNKDVDMVAVRQYAKAKNVKLWVWLYFSDITRQMEEAFKLYESWGIAGVKIDFMSRDDYDMVAWYHNTVKMAAKYHLMVNFHGAYKPTGFRRTYPNLMTREGVLGNEHNKWSLDATPDHNVTLPFTRMLAGPMDYTPGGFLNCGMGEFAIQKPTKVMGTRCHELAKFVIYDSPITTVCDHPENYKGQPGLDFLQVVKAEWDDTRVLSGEIGEYILMARQSGDKWFFAGMTNSLKRAIEVTSDFLPNERYTVTVWKDDVSGEKVLVKDHFMIKRGEKFIINLLPGGGFTAIFE